MNWDGDFLYGMIGLLQGEFQMKLGQITTYFSTSEIATVNSQTGNCSYIPMPGQESGVFVPSNIYGVVSTSAGRRRLWILSVSCFQRRCRHRTCTSRCR